MVFLKHFRPFHALKNILIVPGVALAGALQGVEIGLATSNLMHVAVVFLACCIIAAWNYALNDFCDRNEDSWHPEKKERCLQSAASGSYGRVAWCGVMFLGGAAGIVLLAGLGAAVAWTLALFLLSGFIYNVPPMRLKRFPFIDVAAEAINFPLRMALGWYAILPDGPLPPFSAGLSIWAFGGVLLTGKRAAELARIGDAATARAYRPALLHYSPERALVVSSLYGMIMLFGAGVLFAVYQPLHNLIFLLPAVLAMMGIYLWKLADGGLAARELEPEILLRRPVIWIAALFLAVLAVTLALLPLDLALALGFFDSK